MRAEILRRKGVQMAEPLMRDQCAARRPTGGFVTDPVTGVDSPEFTSVYTGKCKVQTTVAQAALPQAGGHQFTVESLQLHFPVAALLQTGDQVDITEAWDQELVGLTFRIVELARGSYRTADRWNVELVTA